MHLLIIGGSDAGVSAALRAQELDANAEVTMILADDYANFSICGLPYFLSDETPDWRDLAHRKDFPGLTVLHRHVAETINVADKSVLVRHAGGEATLRYDKLVIATGASPVRPDLPGADLDGVFLLHTMDDSFAMKRVLTEQAPRRAVIVGAGYIGLEVADALRQRGLHVTLLSRTGTVMPTVDPALGRMVGAELERHGVRVLTGVSATAIEQAADAAEAHLIVSDTRGDRHPADLVVVAVGVTPNGVIAAQAGATLGPRGAIPVNRRMETTLPDIYAAGDCVETHHLLMSQPTYISLGTIAHKQGRIAGENAVGGAREFVGTLGSQALKVFDLAITRTGLLDHEARANGFTPLTVTSQVSDHKAYYPGAVALTILLTGDAVTGKLLGAQILGHRKAEVSKRVDIVAAAIHQGADVEALNDLDLSYTPPFSSPWDPVQMAAQAWMKAFRAQAEISLASPASAAAE